MDCWYSPLSNEQKGMLGDLSVHLARAFKGFDQQVSNECKLLGAFAEVLFGLHYGLQPNVGLGNDWKDYVVACSRTTTGRLTIDVKASRKSYLEVSEASFRPDSDHVYVFFQVDGNVWSLLDPELDTVNNLHAFCIGFAFGSDLCETHDKGAYQVRRFRYAHPATALNELLEERFQTVPTDVVQEALLKRFLGEAAESSS